MRRLYFIFFVLLGALFMLVLTACSEGGTNDSDETGDGDGVALPPVEIFIPESESFGRGAVSFESIDYKRPKAEELLSRFEEITGIVEASEISFPEMLGQVKEIIGEYSHFLTLYSFITVKNNENIEDSVYRREYNYLFSAQTSFVKAVEDLYVAAADSEYAALFESEYFGEGFVERYSSGSRYTDKTVYLMKNEAALVKRFSALSKSTVNITSDGIYGSYEAVCSLLAERYKDQPEAFKKQLGIATELYEKNLSAQKNDIYISLLKVRKLIAEEMGYSSYAEYAYKEAYHDYTAEEYEDFLKDISNYVIPVYRKLYNQVFLSYFKNHTPTPIDRAYTVNILGEVYATMDKEISDVYSYMLHYGLFNIELEDRARYNGAFTLYLDDYESPVSFVTIGGAITDFLDVAHEFGNFYDMFTNRNAKASLDVLEFSGFGLELLSMSYLRDRITEQDYKYLLYTEMNNMLLTLIYRGFYAEFEHKAYKLAYSDITKEQLDAIVTEVASNMSLNPEIYGDLSSILIEDLFLQPFSVQSYTTSAAVALEVLFLETITPGDGLSRYKILTNRNTGMDFEELLYNAGITSPLESERIKDIANKIHYTVLGSYFYDKDGGGIVASMPVILPEKNELAA